MITNASGGIVRESDYYPFGGERVIGTPTLDDPHKFAGMYKDSESGLYHTWFRMYSPSLARWLSADPVAGSVANPQSLNRYNYVLNNPANLVDPLGLWAICYASYSCDPRGMPGGVYRCDLIWVSCFEFPDGPPGIPSHPGGANSTQSGELARKQAIRTVLSNPDCLGFVLSTIEKGFQQLNRGQVLSPGVAAAQQAATSPTAFVNTLAAAQIVAGPYLGQGVAAVANYVNTITTAPLFNTLGPAAQATALIHETFHLGQYGFSDMRLAETIGWQVPSGVTEARTIRDLASAAFTRQLAKHCGW